MKIEFVNHASYVVAAGPVRLMIDPWLEGPVFDFGWDLLSATAFRYDDFHRITHIWFSHEHPDHFSPPTLKRIPEDARRKITVLFQETKDKKVVEFCRNLGFKEVRELTPGRLETIGDGVFARCDPTEGFADSWLYLKTPGGTLLNLNDCPLHDPEELRAIRQQVGNVDVLSTQFSISAWDGNAEDLERRRHGARMMAQRARMHCREIDPAYVIPFASFIWFCHAENDYMNSGFLDLKDVIVALSIASRAQPLLLYPGDQWTLGERHDNASALERYAADTASLSLRPRHQGAMVPADVLVTAGRRFCAAVTEGSDRYRIYLSYILRSFKEARGAHDKAHRLLSRARQLARATLPEARVWIEDHGRAYVFDLRRGFRPSDLPRENCEVALTSASLHYAFKFLWGGQTLHINGRFKELAPDGRKVLFDYFNLAGWHNFGNVVRWPLPLKVAARGIRGIDRALKNSQRAGRFRRPPAQPT